MKKLVFKIALLSMLLVFVACTDDGTNTGSGSSSLTIPNSTLVAKFFGTMMSHDQNPEARAIAGTAGINEGGVTLKFDQRTSKFLDGNAEIVFHGDDNSAGEQSAALKARIITEARTIIQHANNKVTGLSPLVEVDVEIISDTTATAIVTIKTSGDYKFEDGNKTKTFNINLTGDYFVAPTIIPNEALTTVFNNDQSVNIDAAAGMAGIATGEITVHVTEGVFSPDTEANITFDLSDDDGGKQLVAMKNAVTNAVSRILKHSDNVVDGLNTDATVDVKINIGDTATATVTIRANDGFIFQNGKSKKTFEITLKSTAIDLTIILDATLRNQFDGTNDDLNTALNATSGNAGFIAGQIAVKYSGTAFEADTNAAVTFAAADNSNTKQRAALTASVKQVVENILEATGNDVKGLNQVVDVTELSITDTSNASAKVKVKALDGFTFEDKLTSKEFTITLKGVFVMHEVVSNLDLDTFNANHYQSAKTSPSSGVAGIAIDAIKLNATNGKFNNDDTVAVIFHTADKAWAKQVSAMTKSIKLIVEWVLNDTNKAPLNKIEGLSTKVTVSNIVRKDMKNVTATVTISTAEGYRFEDHSISKDFKITLQSNGFTPFTIDLNRFNIPASSASAGKAGYVAFTIPDGFASVTKPVAVTFNSADNTLDKQKTAVKKAMKEMNVTSKEGIVVSSVGDLNANKTILVTFSPKPGYTFSGVDSKTVMISLSGRFAGVVDPYKIIETPFTLSASAVAPGRAGISSMPFQSGFREPANIRCMSFHSSDKKDFHKRKAAAIRALDKMLTENNSSYPDSDYPFAVEYTKGSIRFKQDGDGDMWWDNVAHFQADLTVDDDRYTFPNGTGNRVITFRLLCTL